MTKIHIAHNMDKLFQEYFRIIFKNFPFQKTFHNYKNYNILTNSTLDFKIGKLLKNITHVNFPKKKASEYALSTIYNHPTITKVHKKRAPHYI